MSEYFNDDQDGEMRRLGRIPRELRCASGWHVLAEVAKGLTACDCNPPLGPTPSPPEA